jgi:hypothetical protein
MRKIFIIVIPILIASCFSNQKNNNETTGENYSNHNDSTILKNGLYFKLKGEWINTSLFDSTLKYKKLHTWFRQFYGNLLLFVSENNKITTRGNMDNIVDMDFKTHDSLSFSFPELLDDRVYKYLPERDLIQFENKYLGKILFRRIQKTDNIEIIRNRQKFNDFFIRKFFTDDFFENTKKPQIDYIWNGFETTKPFDFDAFGTKKNEKGEMDYFGWKIKGDTLEIFNTSRTFTDDGFAVYKIKNLKKRYIKKR